VCTHITGLTGSITVRVALFPVRGDVGLLFSDADLLVAETKLLVICPVLLGVLVGLPGFGMVLLQIGEVSLLDPDSVDAEPELNDDAEELDADRAASEMVFSTLSCAP
jgi:hypothetical protein